MKKYFKKEFMETCKTDIEDICREVYSLLPEMADWQLEKSVIFGEDRKILSQVIHDEDNRKVGYKIDIDILDDCLYRYNFLALEDSISLNKSYVVDDRNVLESESLSMKDGVISRSCSCTLGSDNIEYKDYYKFDTGCMRYYTNLKNDDNYFGMSLNEIFDEVKSSFEGKSISRQRK